MFSISVLLYGFGAGALAFVGTKLWPHVPKFVLWRKKGAVPEIELAATNEPPEKKFDPVAFEARWSKQQNEVTRGPKTMPFYDTTRFLPHSEHPINRDFWSAFILPFGHRNFDKSKPKPEEILRLTTTDTQTTIRILPPWPEESLYVLQQQHYHPSPVQCGGDKCPLCQYYKHLWQINKDGLNVRARVEATKFKPAMRYYFNVLKKEKDGSWSGPYVLSIAKSLLEKMGTKIPFADLADPVDGRDITITSMWGSSMNIGIPQYEVSISSSPRPLGTYNFVKLVMNKKRSLPLVIKSWERPYEDLVALVRQGNQAHC